ncbi:hypothetical protein HPP92_026253 [Vanilla planifolia]|uniref:Filament-like plant protein 7 n=1 Tax=Vanilla planifolia TaxID=51239 RepID=A0A835U7M4_VANPL|nr:hypothetical protein HPP92_026253 [Vanilla planifolia]
MSIDASLKECLQQLNALNNEHQLKMSQEQERTRALEDMVTDKNKMLHQLSIENRSLCGILDIKQNLIDNLIASKSQSEEDFKTIVERLDSSEKDNESLKYEIRMLQKELELRNQERELNLKEAEATQMQHIENLRKIVRLESECQRLRVMIRKRLPGPAAIVKMRSAVEMIGNSPTETRRRTNSSNSPYFPTDFVPNFGQHTSTKQHDKLHAVEHENKILKETLARKNSELQFSRLMFAQTASKLSQCEEQLKQLLKGAVRLELDKSSSVTYQPASSVPEDGGNEDNVSCAESWASALLSQLEQFRNEKQASPILDSGSSNLSLANDFSEIEKLSVVCSDMQESGSISISGEDSNSLTPKTLDLRGDSLESTGKELVPVDDFLLDGKFSHEHNSSFIQVEKDSRWLQGIGEVTEQKHQTTELNPDVFPREFRVGFGDNEDPSFGPISNMNNLHQNQTKNRCHQLNLEESLHDIIKLTEEVIQRVNLDRNRQQLLSLNDQEAAPCQKPALPGEQTACIFLWESSELSWVLKRFVTVCNSILDGKADAEKFTGELASTLGWIIDHCFSFQDVSEMEETIKQRLSIEFSCCFVGNVVEVINAKEANHKRGTEDKFKLKLGAFKMDEMESKLRDENRNLIKEISNIESAKKDLEEKLKSASAKNHSFVTQFQESEKLISNLQSELTTLKNSGGRVKDQIENLKCQDVGTKPSAAILELNETQQNYSAKMELNKNCCEEMDAECLQLQFPIESVSDKEKPKYDMLSEEKELRTDWEISAASEKLAECQDTILKLGKQLKALASPKDAALFDKVFLAPAGVRANPSSRSLNQLLAMENSRSEDSKSPQTKDIICSEPQNPQPAAQLEKADASLLNNEENLIRHALQAESFNKTHERGAAYKQKWGLKLVLLWLFQRSRKVDWVF